MQEKLAEDRRARRLKLGLPEELTEEEKEKERLRAEAKAREAKEAAEKKAAAGLIVKPVQTIDALRKILVDIKKNNPGNEDGVNTCYKTLLAYLGNVMKNPPEEEKYRVIKLSNGGVVYFVFKPHFFKLRRVYIFYHGQPPVKKKRGFTYTPF